MKPNTTAHSRWRRLLPVLALLLVPLLTACMEDLLVAALGDPEPAITAGEDADPSDTGKLCTACTVAEFNQDAGRVTLPNDIVLTVLNETLAADDKATVDGTQKAMPIRIPFDGVIQYPFATGAAPSPAEIAAWAATVFFFATDTPATIIPALPISAAGTFKAVYLDANNDLVLVPGATTFDNGKTYVGVVTKGVLAEDGNPIDEAYVSTLLKLETPLVDSVGNSTISLLTDEQANSLETVRLGYIPIFAGLAAGGVAKADISLVFTFTTEATDSAGAGGSAALIAGMETVATTAAVIDPAAVNLEWLTAGATYDTLVGNAANIIGTFTAAGAPTTGITAVYSGRYPCMDFLDSDGAGDWVIDKTVTPGAACPNSNGNTGFLEFLLVDPAGAAAGTVIFLHGITRDKSDVAAIASALAQAGLATIAIDIWGHGSRTFQIGGADVNILRPDDPSKTVGYFYQTRADIQRLAAMVLTNTELQTAAGSAASVRFAGQSLGAILGSLAASSGTTAFTTALFNVGGGDLVDVALRGDVGAELIPEVAEVLGLEVGSAELNASLLGLELAFRHALFAGLVDPLSVYDGTGETEPLAVLVQQMTGDSTVPNDNTELLSRVMDLTSHSDGFGPTAGGRKRWIYDPANYTPTDAGHGFLLDALTTATTKGQTQAAVYLAAGGLSDPSQ